MNKQVKLKCEVELNVMREQVSLSFWLEEKAEGERWPTRKLLNITRFSLRNVWGMRKDMQTVARTIVKIQNNFLGKFKRLDSKYFRTIQKLCDAYNGTEIVLEDGRTSEFISKFTGQIP